MKRRFSVWGIAGSTPLGTSKRTNTSVTGSAEIETPAPSKMGASTRRLFVTPSMASADGHKMLKGGLGTNLKRTSITTRRVVGKADEENRPPTTKSIVRESRRSSARERILVS